VRAHQFEELASSALNGQRLGNDRRSRRQKRVQLPPALAEWQRPKVGAAQPEEIEDDVAGWPVAPEKINEKPGGQSRQLGFEGFFPL